MIQAILFKKNKWTLKSAKHYLNKIKKLKLNISYRITYTYYRFRIVEPNYYKYQYRIERNFKTILLIYFCNYVF